MTTGDDTVVRRYADAMQRRGYQMVLRRMTNLGGTLPNPPILTNPVLNGAALAGATSIAIRANQADGRILAGDTLAIGANLPIAVSATVTSITPGFDPAHPATPGFATVLLATPLLLPAADGAAIVPAWSADQLVWVMESTFSLTQTNDEIQANDLRIAMAAFGVAQPNEDDQLLNGTAALSIVNVGRATLRGQVVAWNLQAR